jgi:7-keto-8-aminopelargonate synthetase-like enzyme
VAIGTDKEVRSAQVARALAAAVRADEAAAADVLRILRHELRRLNTGKAETAIFPIILGNHNRVMDVARIMGVNGVLANGVPYPAVPRKQTRIRMTVTAAMTRGWPKPTW